MQSQVTAWASLFGHCIWRNKYALRYSCNLMWP